MPLKEWKQVDKKLNVLHEDLRNVDHWLFQLNSGTQWHLLDVDILNKPFKSYNSLRGRDKHEIEVRRWVSETMTHSTKYLVILNIILTHLLTSMLNTQIMWIQVFF